MMVHELIYDFIRFQLIFLPIFIFLIVRKQYLDDSQLKILIFGCLWSAVHYIEGWIMQISKIILLTIYSLNILEICVGQLNQIDFIYKKSNIRVSQQKKISWTAVMVDKYSKSLQILKLEETFLVILVVSLWLVLKAYFARAYKYGIGLQLFDQSIFEGFLKTYNGWNCNYSEYTFFPFIFGLIILFGRTILIGYHECKIVIMRNSKCNENSYSSYFLYYIVNPTLIITIIQFSYNFVAHFYSRGLLDCYYFWKYGAIFQLVSHLGIPIIILNFFYKKNGVFQIKTNTISNSANSSDSNDDITSPQRFLQWERQFQQIKQ